MDRTYVKVQLIRDGLAVDKGSLQAGSTGLVFSGKRLQSFRMHPVQDVWLPAKGPVMVRFGSDAGTQTVGFTDLSEGVTKAAMRLRPFGEELRDAVGLPPATPTDITRREHAESAVSAAQGRSEMAQATTLIVAGTVMLVVGLVLMLASESPGSPAWFFVVVGPLNLLGGVFRYRAGKRQSSASGNSR
jgi:hypothetical protein